MIPQGGVHPAPPLSSSALKDVSDWKRKGYPPFLGGKIPLPDILYRGAVVIALPGHQEVVMTKTFRRRDDPRPQSGFRLELPGGRTLYLSQDEVPGAAQVAQLHQALGASPEEIGNAVVEWLNLRRKAKKFAQGE
jgi:hypothetical protein